jgi:hypothetical protein
VVQIAIPATLTRALVADTQAVFLIYIKQEMLELLQQLMLKSRLSVEALLRLKTC